MMAATTTTTPSAMPSGRATPRFLFADGTFDCSTTRMVTITCTWDADGGMAQGRNALPSDFTAGDNKDFFLKCEAE